MGSNKGITQHSARKGALQDMMNLHCPHCRAELTEAQVITLNAKLRGSRTSEAKRKASRENGRKNTKKEKTK